MDLDRQIREVTLHQSGLVTSAQAMALGASRHQLQKRVELGRLVRVAPHVYALAGMPITERVLLHAALLEASGRSAISHSTAAAHWALPGFTLVPFQVTRLRDGTFEPTTLATVHTTRRLPDSHVVDVGDGLLITTPTRTLFDLAPRTGINRLERLMDHCLNQELTTIALLRRTLSELSGKGQRGITSMRTLLRERVDGYVPAESGLETRVTQVLGEVSLTGFRRQVEIHDADGSVGRVDLLHQTHLLVLEIDSDVHHTSISDVRADAVRQARLEALGYTVVRITEHEAWHRPSDVIELVRTGLEAAPRKPSAA